MVTPIAGQSHAIIVFGYGGRLIPAADLSDAGDALSTGTMLGGGIGLQFGGRSALRASFSMVESDYEGPSLNLGDRGMSRNYLGLDLMFGLPTEFGLAPYAFFGGGRVALEPTDPSIQGFSKLAGRIGAGLNLVPTNSFVVLFVEFGAWLYEFDRLGFESTQLDMMILGGLAFAVPY